MIKTYSVSSWQIQVVVQGIFNPSFDTELINYVDKIFLVCLFFMLRIKRFYAKPRFVF